MAKRILLWDKAFPERAPRRLTVADAIASAAVRAGVAAADDPAEAGALATGAAVSGAIPVSVWLQHGSSGLSISLVMLPLAVAQVAAALGLASGDPVIFSGGAVVLGALTLSGTLTAGTASAGTIAGATAGSTITSNVAGLTVNSGARTYSWTGGGSAGATANGLVETLVGAVNSPNASSVTVNAAAVAPTNTVLPAISGTAQSGQVLTVTTGTWTGSPTGYAYQWQRGGTNVGTNANSYAEVDADVGATITCTVTATNTAGSTSATSAATAAVAAASGGGFIPSYDFSDERNSFNL